MRAAEQTSTLGRVTLVLLASSYAQTAGAQCQSPYRIEWPASLPRSYKTYRPTNWLG